MPQPTKIADLVQKSHETRSKAKQLLEKAKIKIEELIKNKNMENKNIKFPTMELKEKEVLRNSDFLNFKNNF